MLRFDLIPAVPLLPVLAVQALRVRKHTLVLPEPPGPRKGTSGSGPALSLLLAGDSSAAGVGAPDQTTALGGQLARVLGARCQLSWQVEARTGDRTSDTLQRLSELPRKQFDVAVTALGVNDVTRLTSPDRFQKEQTELLHLLTRKFGVRLILLSGVPPMERFPALPQPLAGFLGKQAERLDQAMARAAALVPQARHLPFDLPPSDGLAATDGYHPNERAYALWAGHLADRIDQELANGFTPAASAAPSAPNK